MHQEPRIVLKNKCDIVYNTKLVNDAIQSYKDLLIKRIRGHYVDLKDILPVYKKILLVKTEATVVGFNQYKCF